MVMLSLVFLLSFASGFSTFLCCCKGKIAKESSRKNPFPRKGVLTYLPKGWGIRAGEGANASPRVETFLTLTPSCAHSVRTLRGGFCF